MPRGCPTTPQRPARRGVGNNRDASGSPRLPPRPPASHVVRLPATPSFSDSSSPGTLPAAPSLGDATSQQHAEGIGTEIAMEAPGACEPLVVLAITLGVTAAAPWSPR